jgi:DNA primase
MNPSINKDAAMPIRWDNLSSVLQTNYAILNVPDMLDKKLADPWDNVLEKNKI